ncbi:hypothetical protein D3C84_1255360 [compost metagenome]
MTTWTISYQRANNTSTVEMRSRAKPEPEDAARFLLEWAQENIKPGEFAGAEPKATGEPAMLLLRRYGVTVTGITKG